MPSITCTNCGATLKSAAVIPAGKKVKCPKCKELFVVEDEEEPKEEEEEAGDEEEETSAPKKKSKSAKDEDEDDEEKDGEDEEERDEDDEDEKPKKGKKKDAKKGGSATTIILVIVGVVLLLCCGGCGVAGYIMQATIKGFFGVVDAVEKDLKKVQDELDKAGKDKKTELKSDFKVTSVELASEWIKNEKAAEKKYNEKVIEVTGEVAEVGPNEYEIWLKGVKRKPTDVVEFRTRVFVPEDQQAKAHRFSLGQKVKAVGKYRDSQGDLKQGGWVTLADCTFTELEPTKIIITSAVDLAKEFDNNAKSARTKYRAQDAIITGLVDDIITDNRPGKLAVLKGTGKTRILTRVGFGGQPNVMKGHTLVFRGELLEIADPELKGIEFHSGLILSSK